ncbi:hypothetical protein HY623_02735 [Candidatus Uhrbacteria bacterium]|nr:hypothetical protein [Candidatus Uhrbacteria bacterium]
MADPKQRQLSQEGIHIMYGVIFALLAIGALIAIVLTRSLTDSSSQTSGVTNALPSFNTVAIAGSSDQSDPWNADDSGAGITFTSEGSTNTVYIHGKVTDNNGCIEVKKANAAWTLDVYRTNVSGGSGCTANNNDCYKYATAAAEAIMTEDTCTEDGTDVEHQFEFAVPLQYYADSTSASAPTYSATTWTASVGVTDSQAGAATAGTDTVEINTYNALNVSATIDFSDDSGGSSLALGFTPTTTQETAMTVTNTGNNTIDVQVSGTALDCAAGYADIPVGNTHWATAASTAYASGTVLSATPATADVNIAKSNNGAAATGSIYWKLAIPSTGVGGTCSSAITATAADHDGT